MAPPYVFAGTCSDRVDAVRRPRPRFATRTASRRRLSSAKRDSASVKEPDRPPPARPAASVRSRRVRRLRRRRRASPARPRRTRPRRSRRARSSRRPCRGARRASRGGRRTGGRRTCSGSASTSIDWTPVRRRAPDREAAVAVVVGEHHHERPLAANEERRCAVAQPLLDLGQAEADAAQPLEDALALLRAHQRLDLSARSMSRFASRSATVRRLSRTSLPRASASSIFTRPSLK